MQDIPDPIKLSKWLKSFGSLPWWQKLLLSLIILAALTVCTISYILSNRKTGLEIEVPSKTITQKDYEIDHLKSHQLVTPFQIPSDRRMALTGTWEGEARPVVRAPGAPETFPVTYEFKTEEDLVTGHWYFHAWDGRGTITDNFKGKFIDEDCFTLEYEHHENRALGMGVAIFKLHRSGTSLTGIVTGRSSYHEGLFATQVTLHPCNP